MVLLALLAVLLLPACVSRQRCCPRVCAPRGTPEAAEVTAPAGAPTVAPARYAFYDATGAGSSFEAFVTLAREADLVAFGELHGEVQGAGYALRLLEVLAKDERPVALAMEFVERDGQRVLDDYLAGRVDEATFKKEARQGGTYDKAHKPLFDYCKAKGIPVIAANSPRRLVKAYRKSDADYAAFKDAQTPEDRALLPRSTSTPDDAYRARFMALMGEERGASFFRAQALWDDAMAEACADFRAANPGHRIMLIVGAFHVRGGLGTITKYAQRRPDDRARILCMRYTQSLPISFDDEDRDAGDVVLKVHIPATAPSGHAVASPVAPATGHGHPEGSADAPRTGLRLTP